MTRRALGSLAVGLIMFGLTVVAVGLPASGQAPKRGGILNSLLTEDLVQWPHVRNLVPPATAVRREKATRQAP